MRRNSTARFTGRVTVVPVATQHHGTTADSKMVDHPTRNFDGSVPADYWTRCRWMMGVQYADFSDKKSSWGAKIFTHLRGEAERLVEHVDELAKEGGHAKILDEILGNNYPKKLARDLQA